MTEYRYGEDAFIPPTQLRRALSILYKDLERFQLGKIVRSSSSLMRANGSRTMHLRLLYAAPIFLFCFCMLISV